MTEAFLLLRILGDERINNLQAELNNISLLRKQLEDDILANWNLRKELEEQIKANKGEEETLFSWGDQTSYMSICIGEQDPLNLRIDQLSLEELKKKIMELLLLVKELHSVNQSLREKQLDGSKVDSVAQEKLQTLDENERTVEIHLPTLPDRNEAFTPPVFFCQPQQK
ncbi:UNVERIFIED_CONTAM: hypothetical protein K2H54_046769 [Gekko kuhli]